MYVYICQRTEAATEFRSCVLAWQEVRRTKTNFKSLLKRQKENRKPTLSQNAALKHFANKIRKLVSYKNHLLFRILNFS